MGIIILNLRLNLYFMIFVPARLPGSSGTGMIRSDGSVRKWSLLQWGFSNGYTAKNSRYQQPEMCTFAGYNYEDKKPV